MRNSQNVWIDGTLKHGDYFAKVFREVRRAHPEYKIAIFEVTASEDTVRRRVTRRAAATPSRAVLHPR